MKDHLVLVVDRDEDTRTILGDFLVSAGYRVAQAADGHAALQLAARDRPSVIVGEHPIPLSSRETLCEALRRDPATAHIPFLAVTAHAMPEELADANRLHEAVFSKPPDFAAVVRAIDQLIARPPAP